MNEELKQIEKVCVVCAERLYEYETEYYDTLENMVYGGRNPTKTSKVRFCKYCGINYVIYPTLKDCEEIEKRIKKKEEQAEKLHQQQVEEMSKFFKKVTKK